jgi:GTP cyclohydrolase I
MGALEEAHLAAAVAAACACEEEDDDLELLGGEEAEPLAAAADAMEPAVRALLVGLGEDDRREGLRRTPKRVAKAFRDGTRGIYTPLPLPSVSPASLLRSRIPFVIARARVCFRVRRMASSPICGHATHVVAARAARGLLLLLSISHAGLERLELCGC